MDGFDLGVGILFPAVHGRAERDVMVNSVAPVWDGNETWLVLGGGGLFAVFPLAYATIFPALYMPLILMLIALVFRGVAFEMRFRVEGERSRLRWDRSFSWGSYAAAFCQGICLGALVQGIRVEGRAYAGGWWDWLTPFTILTGIGVAVGYGLLGSTWLNLKTTGPLQEKARRLALIAGVGTVGLIGVVSLWTPFLDRVYFERWFGWPTAFFSAFVPLLVVACTFALWWGLRTGAHLLPFLAALGLFVLSFAGIGISFYPYIVPGALTIA